MSNPITEEQADKAVAYWCARADGLTPDNGAKANLDGDVGSMASLMSGMLFKKPSPEALKAFGERLRYVLLNKGSWKIYHFDGRGISVDYSACPLLSEIAEETGVCKHNFPWKTTIRFDSDGTAIVRESAQGPWVPL